MLDNFPKMINSRVSLFEVSCCIARVSLYEIFILDNLMNLILKKYHHYKDPLLKFRRIFEIFPVTDIIVISSKSQHLCYLYEQRILWNVVNNKCVEILLENEKIYIDKQDYVISNEASRI
jgi:hypothetical protein